MSILLKNCQNVKVKYVFHISSKYVEAKVEYKNILLKTWPESQPFTYYIFDKLILSEKPNQPQLDQEHI